MNDIIIIIPTKGRQNYLNRVASYYSKFDIHTYICDAYQTKCEVDSYDTIHYQWNPQKGFFEELLDVVNETDAPYYLLAPDDDFIKYETLRSCFDKMQNDNRIALGTGRQLFFREAFDGHFIYFDYHNKMSDSSVNFVNMENASFFERNYQNIHWSLFRRDCLVDALSILDRAQFNYACFAEFVFGVEGIRHGGIYFDDGCFNYREESLTPHWGSVAPSIAWKNVLSDKKLRSDIKKLKCIYGDNYRFVKKCLISYMNAPLCVISRIKSKFRHIYRGSYLVYEDSTMRNLINDAIGHMK